MFREREILDAKFVGRHEEQEQEIELVGQDDEREEEDSGRT